MRWTAPLLAMALAAALACATPVAAKTFRLATTTDASTLDPHANNALHTALLLEQIYEPLIQRDADLKTIPCLALAWEQPDPARWRFHLRPGVQFQDGAPLTADDVVFSLRRAMAPTSNYTVYVDTVADVVAVDALTVDVVTRTTDAALPDKLTRVQIMNRAWAEANRSTLPQNFRDKEESFASRHANGTGPYAIQDRQNDQRTVLIRRPGWWGGPPGPDDVTEYRHVIIAADNTRIAALLSGEVDMVHTVPTQNIDQLRRNEALQLVSGPENRTVMLGMDQRREPAPGQPASPFADVRVREALALTIDMGAIAARSLRGQAAPTGSMWTRAVNGWAEDTEARPPLDRPRARALLTEAGYPQGFETRLDCAIGSYEEACRAMVAMMAQVGIRAALQVAPAAQYSLLLSRQQTQLYVLAWGAPTFDALYTLRALMASRGLGGAGTWNVGGYANPAVDDLIRRTEAEPDPARRRALIHEAHLIHNREFGHIPLYSPTTAWALRPGVAVRFRADNLVHVADVKLP